MVKIYYRDLSSKRPFVPRRSFIDGMASVLDTGGTYRRNLDYHYRVRVGKKVRLDSDTEAIRSDWMQTGLDIYNATCEYGSKLPKMSDRSQNKKD